MRDFRGSGLGSSGAGIKVRVVRSLRVDNDKVARLIGDWTVERIRERTRRGVSSEGRPFTPYRDSTRKREGAAGRVDLDKDGALLRSLRVLRAVATRQGFDVRVGVSSDLEKLAGFLHYGTRNMAPRPWLALSREDLRDLDTYLERRNVFREVPGS